MRLKKRNYQLQLPVNFVEIEKDEREYVEGGIAISVENAGHLINLAIAAATKVPTGAIASYVKSVGKKEAKKIFTKTATTKLKSWGLTNLATWVPLAVEFALEYSDVGGAIANFLDSHDTYHNNGWIG